MARPRTLAPMQSCWETKLPVRVRVVLGATRHARSRIGRRNLLKAAIEVSSQPVVFGIGWGIETFERIERTSGNGEFNIKHCRSVFLLDSASPKVFGVKRGRTGNLGIHFL